MRRQTELGGATSAGSGRDTRLDPFMLPIRFAAQDASADGGTRIVELDGEQVVLRRTLRGMRMALRLPVAHYRGVAFRMQRLAPGSHQLSVTLEHPDPALCVPLSHAHTPDDIIAEWQLWARVLRLPLLIEDAGGALRSPYPCIGQVRIGDTALRRRRRTAIRRRRPRIVMRRVLLRASAETHVHAGEREIIARN